MMNPINCTLQLTVAAMGASSRNNFGVVTVMQALASCARGQRGGLPCLPSVRRAAWPGARMARFT